VNNASVLKVDFLEDISISSQLQMLNTNVNSYLVTSHFFLPRFLNRWKNFGARSAIINVSSSNTFFSVLKMTPYSATKAYEHALSQGIQAENPHLDSLTVYPFSVKSNMNPGLAPGTITSAQCAKSIIDSLGWEPSTIGHAKHGRLDFVARLPGLLSLMTWS